MPIGIYVIIVIAAMTFSLSSPTSGETSSTMMIRVLIKFFALITTIATNIYALVVYTSAWGWLVLYDVVILIAAFIAASFDDDDWD